MNNIFNNYDSENDERLDKKFSYNYQVIKNVYPKVSKLQEDEVREIIRKYYDATGTHEDSMQAVMNYIREKEPEWKRLYFKDETLENGSRIQPMTEKQKKEAEALARQIRPEMPNMFTDDIVDNIWNKYAPYLPTYELGRFGADVKIAYDHWQDMNKTNKILINKYGRGAAAGTDDYYHALLQCRLAQISPQDKINGILLGYSKEFPYDYVKKIWQGQNHRQIIEDSQKDLKKNEYGSNMGSDNLNKACTDLLDHLRTRNMKNENIR